jgi:hypothetical protein
MTRAAARGACSDRPRSKRAVSLVDGPLGAGAGRRAGRGAEVAARGFALPAAAAPAAFEAGGVAGVAPA